MHGLSLIGRVVLLAAQTDGEPDTANGSCRTGEKRGEGERAYAEQDRHIAADEGTDCHEKNDQFFRRHVVSFQSSVRSASSAL